MSLDATFSAAAAREKVATAYESYSDLLVVIKDRNIAPQEGITAENARGEFERSIINTRHIAEVNRVKSNSYAAVHRTVSEFRNKLRELAEGGNSRINEVNSSQNPLPAKVAEIIAIVMEIRGQAMVAAADCAGDINAAIREVLASQGFDMSPQGFATENGVVAGIAGATEPDQLRQQVEEKLGGLGAHENAPAQTAPTNVQGPQASAPSNAAAEAATLEPEQVPAESANAPAATTPQSANSPADETLAFSLEELPSFREVFSGIPSENLDIERITFSIDDELEHAVSFVKLAFQE